MYPKKKIAWLKHIDFLILDCIAFYIAWAVSVWFRYGTFVSPPDMMYGEMRMILFLISIVISISTETHSGILRRGYLMEFKAVMKQTAYLCVAELFILFFLKAMIELSRMVFVYFGIAYFAIVYCFRILWKLYLNNLGNVFERERSVILLTDLESAQETAQQVKDNTSAPFRIIGFCLLDNEQHVSQIGDYPVLEPNEDIFTVVRNAWVDEVFVRVSPGKVVPEETLDRLRRMGITVHLHLNNRQAQNQMIEKMFGCNVLTTCVRATTIRQMFIKRTMDVVGSLFGLLLTAVVTVVIGPMIYIQSPGPIFFSQERIGRNGKHFKIYKFRSMYLDAEERKKELMEQNKMSGHMFKMDADPRIIGSGEDGTKHGIGWFIRKTSLDEFPQFWNVLKGEMSLVGTRPPTVDEWEGYSYYHRARMAAKPGITGMWQVSGRSDITDFEEVVSLDMQYIENWTLSSDIKILFKTILVVFKGKGSV